MGGLVTLILSAIAAALAHEGGHWVAALCFGHVLQFRRQDFRGIWTMPGIGRWKQKTIAISGFGIEFAGVPIFYLLLPEFALPYATVAVAHFVTYPFYAGEETDFKWL